MATSLPSGAPSDICIAGAGLIGLSLALELDARGLSVTVIEAGKPLAQASTAAAGMLAAHDPENPPQLLPLSNLSLSLYPAFLDRLRQLGGVEVPLQTSRTLQTLEHPIPDALTPAQLAEACPALVPGDRPFISLDEQSLDPRQLAEAVLAAVHNTRINLLTQHRLVSVTPADSGITVQTSAEPVHAANFIDCTGAWSHRPVSPRKGQLFYLDPPPGLDLRVVLRTPHVYIVPRTAGPNAGRILIGATVEDAGYNTATSAEAIARLQSLAAELLPPLASAPVVESWAGLRPATPDALPLIGQLAPHHFIAAGHFRNGILLAPGTARIVTQLLTGEVPSGGLAPFDPHRFRS